ncbi:hypothetical protein H2203_008337 [Taxawa tesnikishii (nom. ined.)]|nr:hypothetical protein H2203_008337 [Dothideales sp. JES 119]
MTSSSSLASCSNGEFDLESLVDFTGCPYSWGSCAPSPPRTSPPEDRPSPHLPSLHPSSYCSCPECVDFHRRTACPVAFVNPLEVLLTLPPWLCSTPPSQCEQPTASVRASSPASPTPTTSGSAPVPAGEASITSSASVHAPPPPPRIEATRSPFPRPTVESTSSGRSSWSAEEDAACIAAMRLIVSRGEGGTDARWAAVSAIMASRGYRRRPNAVKNQWNRRLRALSGAEDRGVRRRSQALKTSLLGSKVPSGAVENKRAGKQTASGASTTKRALNDADKRRVGTYRNAGVAARVAFRRLFKANLADYVALVSRGAASAPLPAAAQQPLPRPSQAVGLEMEDDGEEEEGEEDDPELTTGLEEPLAFADSDEELAQNLFRELNGLRATRGR